MRIAAIVLCAFVIVAISAVAPDTTEIERATSDLMACFLLGIELLLLGTWPKN